MQDCFVMFMLANADKSPKSFSEIKDRLTKIGEEMKLEVWVQKKAIFDKMHTI